MSFGDVLLTAILSSGVTVGAVALLGAAFKATAVRMIGHLFDLALEREKSSLKREEDQWKAALSAQASRLDTLQASLLAGMQARNEMLDKRRIEAVERIWTTVIELGQLEMASTIAQTVKMDEALASAAGADAEATAARKFAATMIDSFGLDVSKMKPLTHSADKERPFVTPLTWALFSTYRSVVMDPVMRLGFIKIGTPAKFIKNDRSKLIEATRTAIPYMSEFIDTYGAEALPYLVENLRERLLEELIENLSKPQSDEQRLEQATAILKAIDAANRSVTPVEAAAVAESVPKILKAAEDGRPNPPSGAA